jgi:hypothetical protein
VSTARRSIPAHTNPLLLGLADGDARISSRHTRLSTAISIAILCSHIL